MIVGKFKESSSSKHEISYDKIISATCAIKPHFDIILYNIFGRVTDFEIVEKY